MIDYEAEREARTSLLQPITVGAEVVFVLQEVSMRGRITAIRDNGSEPIATILPVGGSEAKAPVSQLVRVWPGLNRGEHPVGGWKKLLDKQASRNPQPCIGQTVRYKSSAPAGVVVSIEHGRIGFTNGLPNTSVAGNMFWALPVELQVQSELDVEKWEDFAEDVSAAPPTPILDLPAPYCNIRRISKSGEKWVAQDDLGKLIAVLNEEAAFNLSVQLFWEFGLKCHLSSSSRRP